MPRIDSNSNTDPLPDLVGAASHGQIGNIVSLGGSAPIDLPHQIAFATSNSDPGPLLVSDTSDQPDQIALATLKLEKEITDGNIGQAIEAVKVLFQEGRASIANLTVSALDLLPVVKALKKAIESPEFERIPPRFLHLPAKTLRLFAELTVLQSNASQGGLSGESYESVRESTIEALASHIKNAKKDKPVEVEYELHCAQEACKRWSLGVDTVYKRYYGTIYRLLVPSIYVTRPDVAIKESLALLDDLNRDRRGGWYDQVLAIRTLEEYTSSDDEPFKEVHSRIGKIYVHRFRGRRSKILLGVVDTLADAVWNGDMGVQEQALRGHDGNPGLAQLAAVAPFPQEKSKNLWKVRYHAVSHLTALKDHTHEKTQVQATEILKSLREKHKKVQKRLADLERVTSLESYRCSFTVDTRSWGIDFLQERLREAQFLSHGYFDRRRSLGGSLVSKKEIHQPLRNEHVRFVEIGQTLAPTKQAVGPHVLPPFDPDNYIPRERLERAIKDRLVSQEGSRTTLTVIQGMGGMGKTTLALSALHSDPIWAHYQERRYWFHSSDNRGQLENQFHQLAVKLRLIDPTASRDDAVASVLAYFNSLNESYLIVFHNADTPDFLQPYLPEKGGTILVTTRNPTWLNPVRVEELAADHSLALIKKILKEDPDASELAVAMGHHPLGLMQACAYIQEKHLSIAEFLKLLKNYSGNILSSHPELRGKTLPESVATLWSITLDKLDHESSALLKQLAYISPDKIPLSLAGKMGTQEARETLFQYALVEEREDHTLSIPRLLQMVVRLRDTHPSTTFQKAFEAFTATFVHDPPHQDRVVNWGLLPHGEALLGEFASLTSQSAELLESQAFALVTMGRILEDLGDVPGARKRYEEALAVAEGVYGSKDPRVAIYLDTLGSALGALGDAKGAKEKHERALKISEQEYGPDHYIVAMRLNNLGLALQDLGRAAEAKEKHERALEISKQKYGPSDSIVAIQLNSLGNAQRALGDVEGARERYERALEIDEAAHGLSHPRVATRLNSLGIALCALGDAEGAFAKYKQALSIDERIYGADHPNVARDLNGIGNALRALGDAETAQAMHDRALSISETRYSPSHPDVAICCNNLGLDRYVLRDIEGAKKMFVRALDIGIKVYGPEHPNVATYLISLGTVLRDLGDEEGAKQKFQQAIAIDEKIYGPDHPTVAIRSRVLEGALDAPGDTASVKQRYELVLAVDYPERHLALTKETKGSPQERKVIQSLGAAYYHRERFPVLYEKRQETILAKLHGISDRVRAPSSTDVAYSRLEEYRHELNLSDEEALSNDWQKRTVDDYEEIVARCKGHAEKYLSAFVPILTGLGKVLSRQRKTDQTLDCFERVLKITEASPQRSPPDAAPVFIEWGIALQRLGRVDKAVYSFGYALTLVKRSGKQERSDVRACLSELDLALQLQGELDQTIRNSRRVSLVTLALFRSEDSQLFSAVNSLTAAQTTLKSVENTVALCVQTLDKEKGGFGEQGAEVEKQLTAFGSRLEKKNSRRALSYYQKTLSVFKVIHASNIRYADLLSKMGTLARTESQLENSLHYCNLALEIDRKLQGESSLSVARDRNNLGLSHQTRGDIVEAIHCYKRALSICEQWPDESKESRASILDNLGNAQSVSGNHEKAIDYHKQALALDEERSDGRDLRKVAIRLNNLGESYRRQEKPEQAIDYYERALQIFKTTYSPTDPTVATTYNNLALASQAVGKLVGAVNYLKAALEIDRDAFGELHINVVRDLNNLGRALKNSGNCEDAINCYEEALAVAHVVHSGDHPDIAQIANSLGIAWHAKGKRDRALSYLQEAVVMSRRLFGPNHSTAQLYARNRDKVQQSGEALPPSEETYNLHRFRTIESLESLGWGSFKKKHFAEAFRAYGRARDMRSELRLSGVRQDNEKIGQALIALGQIDEARELFVKELNPLKAPDLQSARWHHYLLNAYKALDNRHDAEEQCREALTLYRQLGCEEESKQLETELQQLEREKSSVK